MKKVDICSLDAQIVYSLLLGKIANYSAVVKQVFVPGLCLFVLTIA